MTRILRAKTAGKQPTVPKAATTEKRAASWHDEEARRRVTTRARIRRLFARDPNDPTFSAVANQFTNNPNLKFDPSKSPGSVQVKAVPKPPRGADSGHMKVIKPNRTTLFGGKTLRRR